MFKVDDVEEETDEGRDPVPSMSFSSVLSLSSLSKRSLGLSGAPPLLPDPDRPPGKYPGRAPGNKLEAGCLRGPPRGCPGIGGKSLISAAAICSAVSSVGSPVCVRICCCNTKALAYFL